MTYNLLFYLSLIEDADAAEYFKYVYVKYQGVMYRTALSVLHDHARAEDAVHNAFFKLASKDERLSQLMEYKYTPKEAHFLMMVSKQCALNMVDSASSKHEELSDFNEDLTGKYYGDPNFVFNEDWHEEIVDADVRELNLALKYLPDEYNNLIMMIYYYNFTTEQIMEDTEMDRKTLYVKKSRALRRLREIIKDIRERGLFSDV
ncbi:MAG: sigma-70 family RNA polymerase sigma factor [Ruminococcaceae bacterium]|nr:sigma-70 family RNA polymerase sigma factor [Oscillospiraceae bacterium]